MKKTKSMIIEIESDIMDLLTAASWQRKVMENKGLSIKEIKNQLISKAIREIITEQERGQK